MVEDPQGRENTVTDRFAPKELEIALAGVNGQLRGFPEEPEAEPLGVAPSPRTRRNGSRVACAASGTPRRPGFTAGRCRHGRRPPSCPLTAGPAPRSAVRPPRPRC